MYSSDTYFAFISQLSEECPTPYQYWRRIDEAREGSKSEKRVGSQDGQGLWKKFNDAFQGHAEDIDG